MSFWCPTLNNGVYIIVVLELNTSILDIYKVWVAKEVESINEKSLHP